MALTLEAELRLRDAHLIALFNAHEEKWLEAAQQTYAFVLGNYPQGAVIRPDDVAKPLRPIIEVDQVLRDELSRRKLKQKFWVSDFVDLIIERTWDRLPPPPQPR
jgi:hypothetical protein